MTVEQPPLVDRKIESLSLMKNLEDGCPRNRVQDDNKNTFIYIKNISAFSSFTMGFLKLRKSGCIDYRLAYRRWRQNKKQQLTLARSLYIVNNASFLCKGL